MVPNPSDLVEVEVVPELQRLLLEYYNSRTKEAEEAVHQA